MTPLASSSGRTRQTTAANAEVTAAATEVPVRRTTAGSPIPARIVSVALFVPSEVGLKRTWIEH